MRIFTQNLVKDFQFPNFQGFFFGYLWGLPFSAFSPRGDPGPAWRRRSRCCRRTPQQGGRPIGAAAAGGGRGGGGARRDQRRHGPCGGRRSLQEGRHVPWPWCVYGRDMVVGIEWIMNRSIEKLIYIYIYTCHVYTRQLYDPFSFGLGSFCLRFAAGEKAENGEQKPWSNGWGWMEPRKFGKPYQIHVLKTMQKMRSSSSWMTAPMIGLWRQSVWLAGKKMLSSDNQCTNLKEMHWYMIFLSYLNTRSEISPAMSDYLITWHLPRLAGIKAGLSAAEVARL